MLSSRRVLVGCVLALSVMLLPLESASACSCAPTSFAAQTQTYDEIMRVRIRGGGIELFGETWYRGRVQRTFNGCTTRGQWVLIRTPTSSAACGVTLTANTTYLLFASPGDVLFGSATYTIGACAMQTPWSSLSPLQRQTLLGVYGCCGDACTCADGSPPVACFANPCDTVACTSASTCTPNYCGGCKAEFLNAQGEVTCSDCDDDDDCPSSQLCTPQGVCDSGCVTDADCPNDAWCRPVEDSAAPSQCTPYQQLGQPCGGFTPYWAATQCMPSLTCLGDPAIPDLPGTCESPCNAAADCATSSYCSEAQVCLNDGVCQNASDCDADGNDYPTLSCSGYATCSSTGACEWKCIGVPGCDDLSGQNFGLCTGILGWGVVGGVCAQVSGCSSGDTPLFDSASECLLSCGAGELPF